MRMPKPAFTRPAKSAPLPPAKRFHHPKFGEGALESQDGVGPDAEADGPLRRRFEDSARTVPDRGLGSGAFLSAKERTLPATEDTCRNASRGIPHRFAFRLRASDHVARSRRDFQASAREDGSHLVRQALETAEGLLGRGRAAA